MLTGETFANSAPHPASDTRQATEALVALACQRRQQRDALARRAVAAGGTTCNDSLNPGFRYGHGFQNLAGGFQILGWLVRKLVQRKEPGAPGRG